MVIEFVSLQCAHVIRIVDGWQQAGLPHATVSAFGASRRVPALDQEDRHSPKIGVSASTKVRHWRSLAHFEDGNGPEGKNHKKGDK
jgi:hypothetical protein